MVPDAVTGTLVVGETNEHLAWKINHGVYCIQHEVYRTPATCFYLLALSTWVSVQSARGQPRAESSLDWGFKATGIAT